MTTEVAPGVWSIPVWIPIPALERLNAYALELAGGGIALVDTGWEHEKSWASLVEGLAAQGWSAADVRAIVVTHAHPDHLGLAHRIREISDAPIIMHEVEARRLRTAASATAYREAVLAVFPRWGVGANDLEALAGNSAEVLARTWEVDVEPVRDGDDLGLPGWKLQAVWTPGHTAGHLSLFDPEQRLLFSGDHVLNRISPVVAVHPRDESDPLTDFLASLDRVDALDPRLVLPGHEAVLTDLPRRVAELKKHHADRLAAVHAVIESMGVATTWDVMQRLTWSRPLEQCPPPTVRLALAETQAHLVHLEVRGELKRTGADPERWGL